MIREFENWWKMSGWGKQKSFTQDIAMMAAHQSFVEGETFARSELRNGGTDADTQAGQPQQPLCASAPQMPPSCKACPFNKLCRVLSHGCGSCAEVWRHFTKR